MGDIVRLVPTDRSSASDATAAAWNTGTESHGRGRAGSRFAKFATSPPHPDPFLTDLPRLDKLKALSGRSPTSSGPVCPMYHDHPLAPEAYAVANQFLFGPDLLVAPITTPGDARTHLGQVTAWLPPGTWFDALTGRR